MNQNERLVYLIKYLCKERNVDIEMPESHDELFQLYRSLVNIREAKSIAQEFLKVQDQMLQEENKNKGIVSFDDVEENIIVWQGDITRLKVGAIVNAANNQMEGCFVPGHHCIDNAIHSYAGVQLRNDCHQMMQRQGFLEPTGKAKITKASCYESCLRLAEQYQLKTIAFCCISTGVFHFLQELAAEIAIKTVKEFLKDSSIEKVIFNVFKDEDYAIYNKLLQ